MDNNVMCECCKELKDREKGMFPIKLIMPAYTPTGELTICLISMCCECVKKCANSLKDYIQIEDSIIINNNSFVA